MLNALIASMRTATVEQRSSDAGLAAWQFAENLTTLLPAAEGKRAVLTSPIWGSASFASARSTSG